MLCGLIPVATTPVLMDSEYRIEIMLFWIASTLASAAIAIALIVMDYASDAMNAMSAMIAIANLWLAYTLVTGIRAIDRHLTDMEEDHGPGRILGRWYMPILIAAPATLAVLNVTSSLVVPQVHGFLMEKSEGAAFLCFMLSQIDTGVTVGAGIGIAAAFVYSIFTECRGERTVAVCLALGVGGMSVGFLLTAGVVILLLILMALLAVVVSVAGILFLIALGAAPSSD